MLQEPLVGFGYLVTDFLNFLHVGLSATLFRKSFSHAILKSAPLLPCSQESIPKSLRL